MNGVDTAEERPAEWIFFLFQEALTLRKQTYDIYYFCTIFLVLEHCVFHYFGMKNTPTMPFKTSNKVESLNLPRASSACVQVSINRPQ